MAGISYRILTSWIGDVASAPRMGGRWPMVELTDDLVRDYYELIDLAADWGYNGIVAWGLFTGHNWPVALGDCLDPLRKRRICRILDYAQRRGVLLYVGLGVYSWGFEEIIRENPCLRQGDTVKAWGQLQAHNGDVMCYHQPAAREWMRRIIDFIVEQTDAPAFQLQPFDKGRCMCPQCRRMTDAEYFCALTSETADYIKGRWPDKRVGVSGWGMRYDDAGALEAVRALSGRIDYLSDVTNSCRSRGNEFRRLWTRELNCAFGDSAGGSVTPPQTWHRLRWFLPHIRYNGTAIREAHRAGCGAAEIFAGPLANPGTCVTLKALGCLLQNPEISVETAAHLAVGDTFGVSGAAADELTRCILSAEDAYFAHCAPTQEGDLLFEPLDSVFPGRPTYLLGRSDEALHEYGKALEEIGARMEALRAHVRRRNALDDALCALRFVQAEIGEVRRGAWRQES